MRIHLFSLFVYLSANNISFAQVDDYPLAKKRLSIPLKQNFVHFEDCKVYEYTPDRNNNDTVLVESRAYKNGKLIAELRGDYEGENEYHIDKSSPGGKYLKKYFYYPDGKIERQESYFPKINRVEWTLYYYDQNNLLTKTEEWSYHAKSIPVSKTAEGRVIFALSETEFMWSLSSQDLFTYNNKKQLTEKRHYYSDLKSDPYQIYTYAYDSLNRKKTETCTWSYAKRHEEWKYFDWGYEIHYPAMGVYDAFKSVCETDSKGLVRRLWHEYNDGDVITIHSYNYDQKGRLIQDMINWKHKKGIPDTIHWYEYRE